MIFKKKTYSGIPLEFNLSPLQKKKGGLFCKFPMGKQNETNQTGPVYIHKVKHKQTSADVDLSELLIFNTLIM